jgi:hypothetical protein
MNVHENIIVATWGCGPTYRDRVKQNILKAKNTNYDKIIPYLILTDYVDDFLEFKNDEKLVVDVIDINKERSKYSEWSYNLEYIPNYLTEKEYGIDYREKTNVGKKFSYALNRFSLPTISKMGFNKFLMCDCDTDIRYDKIVNGETTEELFWEEYNTPLNTMKGCDLENFNFSRWPNFEGWGSNNIILANHMRYYLKNKYPEDVRNNPNFIWLGNQFWQTEGPFRFYNLESSKKVMDVFNIWDELMKFGLSDEMFRRHLSPGQYMYIDNVPVTVTNEFLNINPLNFDKFWHTVNIYNADRFFFPQGHVENVNGEILSFQIGETKEEFFLRNKKLIDFRISQNNFMK